MFIPAVLIVIAGLAVLALRVNDRHSSASAVLWILVVVLLLWVAVLLFE